MTSRKQPSLRGHFAWVFYYFTNACYKCCRCLYVQTMILSWHCAGLSCSPSPLLGRRNRRVHEPRLQLLSLSFTSLSFSLTPAWLRTTNHLHPRLPFRSRYLSPLQSVPLLRVTFHDYTISALPLSPFLTLPASQPTHRRHPKPRPLNPDTPDRRRFALALLKPIRVAIPLVFANIRLLFLL
jgi:hypothetical protein